MWEMLVNSRENQLVLAVDDEPDFLELISLIGQGVGCEVITAATHGEFREQLSKRQPALILLDLQMPGMDGIEALRFLARHGSAAGVLLASGMDQRVLVSARQLGESLGLNMVGTLQKPAMVDDIERLLKQHLAALPRITVEELKRAVGEHELVLHYQPKLVREGQDWRVAGAEALVRWQHPKFGLLYPGEFLALAEQSGAIVGISDFVLTEALRQLGHWRQLGFDLIMACNLSPRLVQDLEFPDRLARVLREFDVAPHHLTLEVTEVAPLENPELVMDIFARLRVRGVGLSLDDFGSGTSSLTQLYRMPFSEVKIDNTLTKEVPASAAAATIVRALIDLAHNLSLPVCAEGVENAAAFEFLDRAGCDALQGEHIARSLSAADFERFVRTWNNERHPYSAASHIASRSRMG